MATDATGTPTSPDNIPTYNTAVDAPSGAGFNAAMAALQTALSARVGAPAGIISGEIPVWNGSTWVRSSTTGMTPSGIAGYPSDGTKHLMGDGTWKVPPGAIVGFGLGQGVSTSGTSFAGGAALLAANITYTTDGVSHYALIVSGPYWQNAFAGTTTISASAVVDGVQGASINASSTVASSFVPFAGGLDVGIPSNASHTFNVRIFAGSGSLTTVPSGTIVTLLKVT